ncbi:MAG: family 43 glycosylhydrolase [Mycobacteriales bacterium]
MQALVERFGVPLCPEPDVDQGDPYLVEAPAPAAGGFRYFVYVSGPGFPVYGSRNLVRWSRVGDSLAAPGEAWCWAPCVRHLPGLARPWVMLYSRARGAGDVDGHRGHRIRRADSERPEGPYVDSGEVLTAGLDFAIDPDVHAGPDGPLLTFAADYVADEPYGTGLMEAPVSADLRRLTGPVRPVARPQWDWQLYDAQRSLPWKAIPGVSWAGGRTVRWYTMEGPTALVSPAGRRTMLYSGGNYAGFYGIGVLRKERYGWVDLSRTPQQCLLAPARGLYGPGHCSVLGTGGGQLLCFHFRTTADGPRQFGIVPLRWNHRDLPYVPVGGPA